MTQPLQAYSNITLGILGGGQLGRMSAMAAARLGIAAVTFSPEKGCPASDVSRKTITAPYDDTHALEQFAQHCDFITYEFENIPLETIDYIEKIKKNIIFPNKTLLDVSQDRIREKTFLNDHNIETARWHSISKFEDIERICTLWNNTSAILKTARFGYDGKGQITLTDESLNGDADALQAYFAQAQNHGIIMEERVPFEKELSVVVARDKDGCTVTYGPMHNIHKNHILDTSTVPCTISDQAHRQAIETAQKISDAVNLRGVLCVEFFLCERDRLLVNEIAPRPHNSGHWTIDACAVSQFENHVRCVCGLPAAPAGRHSNAQMHNLIGADINTIEDRVKDPFTCIHLYGKTQVRDGRKMGHITIISPKTESPA